MIKLITFLFLLTILISCKKDIAEQTVQFDGSATALLNGRKWEGNIFSSYTENESCFTRKFFLSIVTKGETNYAKEHIHIRGLDTFPFSKPFINLKPTIYSINGCKDTMSNTKLFIVEGGDVLSDTYHLLEKNNTVNQLKIINFDKKTNELTASFQFDYRVDDTTSNRFRWPHLSDTLHFTEGVLKTKIRVLEK